MALVEVRTDPPFVCARAIAEQAERRIKNARELAKRLGRRLPFRGVPIVPDPPKRDWLLVSAGPILEEPEPVHPERITIPAVLYRVARRTGYSREALISTGKTRHMVYARQEAMYLARALTCRSYPEIGRLFGKRDHTTILHGVRAHADRYGLPPVEVVERGYAVRMLFGGPEASAE